jgi:hypothetical protein
MRHGYGSSERPTSARSTIQAAAAAAPYAAAWTKKPHQPADSGGGGGAAAHADGAHVSQQPAVAAATVNAGAGLVAGKHEVGGRSGGGLTSPADSVADRSGIGVNAGGGGGATTESGEAVRRSLRPLVRPF